MFSMCLSEDTLQNERQKPQLVQERKPGAGCRAADRNRLILSPHTPGAKSGCLLHLDRGALCCRESICGQRHVSPDGRLTKYACVRKSPRDEMGTSVVNTLCGSWTGTL